MSLFLSRISVCLFLCAALAPSFSLSQDAPRFQPPPEFASVEVSEDRKVTFRILAPKATSVRLTGGDLPGVGRGLEMKKGEKDIWEVTAGPAPAGAYRYQFAIDGLSVTDPKNPQTSESNLTTWSVAYIPGSPTSDIKDVPHGAVSEVFYNSASLKAQRRMHVYTPPGYESNQEKYPVFYLLHGASDSDDSWTSVGRVNFILDNLIAEGKCKPMIVVMPNGHIGPFRFGGPPGEDLFGKQLSGFKEEFIAEIRPYIEKRYRVKEGRANRAVAGLSMGGAQTLAIAAAQLGDFGYYGVFSSGIFGITGPGPGGGSQADYEKVNAEILDNADLKKDLKLFWFATGKEDFLLETSRASVAMLKKHNFDVKYEEGEGGHTWMNWRIYLAEFAPQLFQ